MKTIIAVVEVDDDHYVTETTGPDGVRSRDAGRYLATQLRSTVAIESAATIDLDVLVEQHAADSFEDVAIFRWRSESVSENERNNWRGVARKELDRLIELVKIG